MASTNAARSSNWCSTTVISDNFALNGSGSVTHTYTLYGMVAASQNIAPGAYADTLTATIKYSGGQNSGSVGVSANAPASCSLVLSNLNFGSASQAIATATAAVTPTCSRTTGYTIALGQGGNFNGSRRMLGPSSNYIPYGLYTDAGYTVPWGDGGATGAVLSGAGTGAGTTTTLYGRVNVGGFPMAGVYSDTVVVTLTY